MVETYFLGSRRKHVHGNCSELFSDMTDLMNEYRLNYSNVVSCVLENYVIH